MKLQDLNEFVIPYIEYDDARLREIDEAYKELAILHKAMSTGNFGFLISNSNRQITYQDIPKIRKRLASIIRNNILFDGSDIRNGRDGKEKLRILFHQAGHIFEAVALSALGVILGGALIATGNVIGIGAGAAAIAGTGALRMGQIKSIAHLRSAAKLIDIVDTRAKLNPSYTPSAWRRVLNWLSRKKDYQIKREAEDRIKVAARKAEIAFKKAIQGLPEHIEYIDQNGDVAKMSVYDLFEDL